MPKPRVLIAEDISIERESLSELFSRDGYDVTAVADGAEALKALESKRFNIILSDIVMPQLDGMSLLREIVKRNLDTKIILITGFGKVDDAVEAMKLGVYDYITKPVKDDELKLKVKRAIEEQDLADENKHLKQKLATRDKFHKLVGQSRKMLEIYKLIEMMSESDATVLIEGETGTGKELVAKAIHANSPRRDRPFVQVNCGSIPESLLESEMFGHIKGSFTNAYNSREGKFEHASGGTLFLDEIDAFSSALQVKLLRVIQDRQFERVGSNTTIEVDVRIIAASNQDLQQTIEDGTFRLDLYYRLNVIHVHMPPLRDRMDDLPLLANHFLEKYNHVNNKKIKGITKEAMAMMENYHWPGNVRELENVIERSVVLEQDDYIQPDMLRLPEIGRKSDSSVISIGNGNGNILTLKEGVQSAEDQIIRSALEANNWRRQVTAETLGINRITLYNKMQQYDIKEPKPTFL